MKGILLCCMMLVSSALFAQERYEGLTRDSLIAFHKANFETVISNDTAFVVKHKRDGMDWRYFSFGTDGICCVAAKEMSFYDEFTDLEKKLPGKKYKKVGEVEYDFVVRKAKGFLYANGKDNYILMFDPINPNLSRTTRAVVYYKAK